MSNVLVIYEVKDNTTDNNLSGLSSVLSEIGVQFKIIHAPLVSSRDIEWSDILLANRPNSIYSKKIIKAAKKAGRFAIISLDDDIVNLPSKHPHFWKREFSMSCLEQGNVLMSTSPLILDDYCKRYQLRPLLVNSFVREDEIRRHSFADKIRIVYPAGRDHRGIFNKFILPFFDDFVKSYKDKIDVTFIGVEPIVNKSDVVHFVKGMPYQDYLDYMNSHAFDIGLAPLEDNPFCARKYFAKYIEYSRFGILGLYSDVRPYTYAVKDGYNGILVKDDPIFWRRKLEELIDNRQKISNLIDNAQEELRKRFSLRQAVQTFQEGCPEMGRFQCDTEVRYTKTGMTVLLYLLYDFLTKARYHLKHDGLKYFLKH